MTVPPTSHLDSWPSDKRPDASRPDLIARWISGLCGAAALVGGCITLVGWGSDIVRLKDWEGHGITMKPNAALVACAAGAVLLLTALAGVPKGRLLIGIRGLALMTMLVGGLTLFQHMASVNLGIDELLFKEVPGARATASPGRMGPPAASTALVVGTGLLLATLGPRARRWAPAAGLFAVVVASLSLCGFLFRADQLYTIPRLTGISLQMAMFVMAIGIGQVASLPDQTPMRILQSRGAAGILARRTLPFVLGVPVVLGWLQLRALQAGVVDAGMGSAALVLSLTVCLCGLLWWACASLDARERAVARSLEAQQRAELALRGIRDQFVMVDRNWRYTYVNHRAASAMGHTPEELLGRSMWEHRPGIADAELDAVTSRAMLRRQAESVEYHDAATGRWFQQRLYPSHGGGLAIFTVDISLHRHTEASLARSEQRFRTLVSITTSIPWITDARGAFVEPQEAWERYTGQAWSEHREFGWREVIHPEDRDRVAQDWESVVAEGALYETRGRIWHAASGQYRQFVARAAPVLDAAGEVREWVGSCAECYDGVRAAPRPADEKVVEGRAEVRIVSAVRERSPGPIDP